MINELRYGEKMVYHIGLLARDRKWWGQDPVDTLARQALELSNSGRIALTQRKIGCDKHGYGVYEYIATGIKRG